MAISLLYRSTENKRTPSVDTRVLYHFSLDRSFSAVCGNVKKLKYFYDVLRTPLTDPSEIVFRQEIIKDFDANPELFDRLLACYNNFEQLSLSHKQALKESINTNVKDNLDKDGNVSAYQTLQMQALCAQRALSFVKEFYELLSNFSITSEGLKIFLNGCKSIVNTDGFNRLFKYCGRYEIFSITDFVDLKLALNDYGHIISSELTSHKYVNIPDPDLKRNIFSLFRRKEPTYQCERLYLSQNDFYPKLQRAALSDLTDLFSSVSSQIFDNFLPIYKELDFYFIVLKYTKKLKQKETAYCFPEISDDKSTVITELCDLYLTLLSPSVVNTVPNDVQMETNTEGILLFGNNGSGKTVYIRSIGCAQILAQAGLPIPAKQAKITLFSHLATQFSEAEKEFCQGNDAGRFEQEVRELSEMISSLHPDSLVFLNETFQSTSYAEGAMGLYDILEHFTACNIRWILVTHLTQLKDMFNGDRVKKLHTAEGYRIV